MDANGIKLTPKDIVSKLDEYKLGKMMLNESCSKKSL